MLTALKKDCMKKILIIDDHPIARFGLIANIQKDLHPVEIAECGGDNALLSLSKHNFDLIIMEGKVAGVFSFGQIAFFSIGAYVSAILNFHLNPIGFNG